MQTSKGSRSDSALIREAHQMIQDAAQILEHVIYRQKEEGSDATGPYE